MSVTFEVLQRRTDSFIADAVIFKIDLLVLMRAGPLGFVGMTAPMRFRLPHHEPLLHFAPRLDVVAWTLEAVKPKR